MNCTECRESFVPYLEDLLDAGQRQAVDRHLADCPSCRAEMQELAAVQNRLVADSKAVARSNVEEHVMNRIIRELNLKLKSAGPLRRVLRTGRTIMRKPTTKLATAAVIVAAIIISLSHFNEPVVKAVEFSEFNQAVQQVPWMHAIATGFELPVGQSDEHWAGFASRIQATRGANGRVIFMSEKDRRQFEYDPNSNTITISLFEVFPVDMTTAAAMVSETVRQTWEQEGAQVVVKTGDYNGHKVQVQDVAISNMVPGGLSLALTLYVDSESKLLYGSELKSADPVGKVVGTGAFSYDYPPSGPESIHDLGVPRDARILDKMPSVDFTTVWEEYKRRKVEVTDQYIAVTMHQEKSPSDPVGMLDVDYKSGRNERHERYYLSVIPELGAQGREQLGSSLELVLAWARMHYEDPQFSVAIRSYDGQYEYSVRRERESGWGTRAKVRAPYEPDLSPVLAVAWPTIPSTARVIKDDYADQNGLICVENLVQGQVMRMGVGLPGRFLYYLDPAKDYLCRRQVMEWRPDADWQEDKNWLKKVDPKKVGGGSMIVQEITKVFQAPNGHWYPRVIIEKQTDGRGDYRSAPMQVNDIETIYLDVSPTFPDGIFDPNKLPGR
jgi:hypothetical protein